MADNSKKPRETFKKTVDVDESRRKREDESIQIRKTKKEQVLQKRRREALEGKPDPEILQKLSSIPQLVQALHSNDYAVQLDSTVQFRKLLSIEHNPPIDEVIGAGVIPIFINYLKRVDQPHLQFEAAWALTNIASGTTDHTKILIEQGAVPIFIHLLASPVEEVREQCVWALGNIAGDSHLFRDYVLSQGVMGPLLKLANEQPKLTMLRNITWALSNLCRGKPIPEFEMVRPCLPLLSQLIFHNDDEVLTDACWAISYISDGPNDRIQSVLETNIARRLVELLMYHLPSVQTPALRTIGNIVTGNDEQTQIAINCGALSCLPSLLSHPKKSIRKEACWMISNVAAGNHTQIQSVIDAGLIPPVIGLLSTGEFDVKKEAAWALCNATSGGSHEQIRYFVQLGCIQPLCDLLTMKDPKILSVAMETLENILKSGQQISTDGSNPYIPVIEEAGGIDQLEELQSHPSNDIYAKAVRILESYFEVEEQEEDNQVAPTVGNNQQYSFGNVGNPQGGFHF